MRRPIIFFSIYASANNFGCSCLKKILSPSADAEEMFNAIIKTADIKEGGFGKAPKFPQTFTIRWLLHHYYFTGKEKALQQACLSLDKMIDGGINDQLGGGFARYSTDELWLAPHFEKDVV